MSLVKISDMRVKITLKQMFYIRAIAQNYFEPATHCTQYITREKRRKKFQKLDKPHKVSRRKHAAAHRHRYKVISRAEHGTTGAAADVDSPVYLYIEVYIHRRSAACEQWLVTRVDLHERDVLFGRHSREGRRWRLPRWRAKVRSCAGLALMEFDTERAVKDVILRWMHWILFKFDQYFQDDKIKFLIFIFSSVYLILSYKCSSDGYSL